MTAISFENISKTFRSGLKRNTVLKGLNLKVNHGEIFGFLGPNGAGKSTSIKLLLRFIRPDRGRILVDGLDTARDPFQRLIGYQPESPFFYENLTALETLRFAAKASEVQRSSIQQRTLEVLEKMNLSDAASQPIRTYSKGMKQRLALAMALIHDPKIYVLDEPMSGLDPLGRRLISDAIRELGRQGRTVFFSSHILSDVESLCDRIGILHRGDLLYSGSVEDFTKKAASLEDGFVHLIESYDNGKGN